MDNLDYVYDHPHETNEHVGSFFSSSLSMQDSGSGSKISPNSSASKARNRDLSPNSNFGQISVRSLPIVKRVVS